MGECCPIGQLLNGGGTHPQFRCSLSAVHLNTPPEPRSRLRVFFKYHWLLLNTFYEAPPESRFVLPIADTGIHSVTS
jgi:hypothetical protein